MLLLLFDLRMLFFEGVDEDDAQIGVFHPFDFAFAVLEGEERLDPRDLFGDQSDVAF